MAYELKEDDTYRDLKDHLDGIEDGAENSYERQRKGTWYIGDTPRYGNFVSLSEDTVQLDSGGKKNRDIALEELGSAAQAYAHALAGDQATEEESAPSTEPAVEYAFEDWTSADGRAMRAKFVSVKGDVITLLTEDGNEKSFSTSHLGAESQERARELAGPSS